MPSVPPTIASVPNVPLCDLRAAARGSAAMPRAAAAIRGARRALGASASSSPSVVDGQFAAVIGSVAGQQTGLQRDERGGRRRARSSAHARRRCRRRGRTEHRARGSARRPRSPIRPFGVRRPPSGRDRPTPNSPSTISAGEPSGGRARSASPPIAATLPTPRRRRAGTLRVAGESRRRRRNPRLRSRARTTNASPPLLPGPASTTTRAAVAQRASPRRCSPPPRPRAPSRLLVGMVALEHAQRIDRQNGRQSMRRSGRGARGMAREAAA